MTRRTTARARRALPAALVLLAACGGAPEPDAYGNFEAEEVVVSAETGGQLREFAAVEGARLPRGVVVAVVDTTQLSLERRQIEAQRAATRARGTEVTEQVGVLEVQRDLARRKYERARRLHAERAATTQELEQAEREYRTLLAQIEAARAQRQSVGMDVVSGDARVAQIAERIARSVVTNPEPGTVLATYARPGEVVQPGQPLYRIADLDTLVLRAYVDGGQLPALRLGQAVEVRVDGADGGLEALPGTVTWISPEAEFTPTPVQTREERVDLVYAVKVRVRNPDGSLKIGMPAEVRFAAPGEAAP